MSATKRVSRACLYCRQRKSRCDLDSTGSPGTPPCQRCLRENRECVLGGSNRGGRRFRKNKLAAMTGALENASGKTSGGVTAPGSTGTPILQTGKNAERNGSVNGSGAQRNSASTFAQAQDASPMQSTTTSEGDGQRASVDGETPATTIAGAQRPLEQHAQPSDSTRPVAELADDDDDAASSAGSNIDAVPQNPSDAWQYLAHVAKWDQAHKDGAPESQPPTSGLVTPRGSKIPSRAQGSILSYRLVRDALLSTDMVFMLVARYREHYHGYLPLVPRQYFEANMLDSFASEAPHLLTAICTIASKDLVDIPHVHEHCSKYMHELISGIAAGSDCDVEAVEALLLLAEWEPQGLRNRIEAVGRGEEDRAAWMHIGLAVRSAYFLRIDRTAFRSESEDPEVEARRRLAWASCYVSDRLISIRIGRAFWSRGPGPMAGLQSRDFPSLSPVIPGDEDYAKIFQATLDLTQLYGNVHEVLYSGMRTSGQMMLMGDYVKYVDDFRSAISRWNRIWGTLTCSSNLKVTLQMSYEYLRLYTNAFAFQAAVSQALSSRPKSDSHSQRDHLRAAFSDIASMPDARFIYESMDAAKSYLTILNNFVDAERHLRYMPLRYYLYSIYSAVFLYKARSFGVMNAQEEPGVRHLIQTTMDRLRRASVSPQDLGSRYARLLELLWQQRPKPTTTTSHNASPDTDQTGLPMSSSHDLQPGNTTSHHASNSFGAAAGHIPPYLQFSPANDFSWLDLEAVGDYVSGDAYGPPGGILGMGVGSGGGAGGGGAGFGEGNGGQTQWQPGSNWTVDLNGNLLF